MNYDSLSYQLSDFRHLLVFIADFATSPRNIKLSNIIVLLESVFAKGVLSESL